TPHTLPLIPYTTLFRSPNGRQNIGWRKRTKRCCDYAACASRSECTLRKCRSRKRPGFFGKTVTTKKNRPGLRRCAARSIRAISRSEEHTSELQSPDHLV